MEILNQFNSARSRIAGGMTVSKGNSHEPQYAFEQERPAFSG
jgi:hypothetical protein